MGKNVLKFPGVVLRNPSTVLRLFLLLIAFIGVMAAEPDPDPLSASLLKQLNLTRVPHISRCNISQTEFETKHREFFDLVEQNQRRRLNSSGNYDEENIVRKKLFTFTHSGLRNSPSPPKRLINLNYEVNIPLESNKHTEVEETSLRLLVVPRNCATHKRTLTLEVAKQGGGRPFKKETLYLDECLPKWVGVDLTEGSNANLRSSYKVSIRCDDCLRRNIQIVEPYLNVIVNVKSRLRKRRAGRKKKRRFPGKCVRRPWEVDLDKVKGYEYIVQPKKFDAGLCAGRCSGQWNLASQHSNLQYLFSNIDKSVPKPCCAPTKMDSVEILYFDQDDPKKLKMSSWDDTRIVECACS